MVDQNILYFLKRIEYLVKQRFLKIIQFIPLKVIIDLHEIEHFIKIILFILLPKDVICPF